MERTGWLGYRMAISKFVCLERKEDMIIKGARIIDPANGLDTLGDIVIRKGKIADIDTYGEMEKKEIRKQKITQENEEILDASGWIAAPGLIDVHVHFRDPGFTYKEEIDRKSTRLNSSHS